MIVVKNDKIEYLSNDTLVGEVLFQKETDYLVLTTAYIKDEYRGQGLASEMLKEVFNYLKENNIKVKIECSYINHWLSDKKLYQELIVK